MTNNNLTASDHAANVRSANQRATGLAAAASLAASLALSGAGIIADTAKVRSPFWAPAAFGVVLVLTIGAFSAAAVLAVTGHQLEQNDNGETLETLETLSDNKHAKLNTSMWFLCSGMAGVLLLAIIATIAGIADRP